MKVAIDTTNECGLSNKMCDSVKEHKGDAVLYSCLFYCSKRLIFAHQ